MNDIRDLLPNRMRERTFQLKAKRDAGAVWHEPQFVECKQCGRRAARTLWARSLYVCPNCGVHLPIGAYYRLSLVLLADGTIVLTGTNQEHGILTLPENSPLTQEDFPIGRRLRILPNHACPTAAPYGSLVLIENGRVAEVLDHVRGWD